MKILSLYLPGFHKDEINDKAWGEGFTEWDNVKNGKPLFKGHYQPIVPLNNNYYDLSQKKYIEEQIDVANKYKIDGFIFYHYWFGNGITALTTPAEILRDQIDKRIDYCFCWANHSWIKNWTKGNNEPIAPQTYGGSEEWKKHIKYLIPFFKDSRYLKIDGRPMMYIYNMSDIPDFASMLKLWNEELQKENVKELYIVEFISSKNREKSFKNTNAVVEFEPLYTTFFDISKINLFKRFITKKFNKIDFQDYNKLWSYIIKRRRTYENTTIQKGCFVGWDNSARKGYNCMIVKNNTPENFAKNLTKLLENNRKEATNDCIIINAWNEWSEGAYLEPDEKNNFKYLEAIRKVKKEYDYGKKVSN